MLRSQKPCILLAALAAVGTLLTTAQAREQIGAAGTRTGSTFYGNAGDDGTAFGPLQNELQTRWLQDVAAAAGRTGARENNPPVVLRPALIASQPNDGQYVYLPSADARDAKFLVLAGPQGTGTLSGDVHIKLATPPGATTLDIALFDGDNSGRWDQGGGVTVYDLFEDPEGDGPNPEGGDVPVPNGHWTNAQMADNAWTQLTVDGGAIPISATPPAPSGSRFFFLRCRLSTWGNGTVNVFKIRTSSSVRLQPQDAFTVTGAVGSFADVHAIYPAYPALQPTTYDGRWDFYVYVPTTIFYDPDDTTRISAFEVWDGDLDFGDFSLNAQLQDSDDPNTSSPYPAWATQGNSSPEGIAVGVLGATGSPNDDHSSLLFRRGPAVRYDVTDPSGTRYVNGNPSGNQEWERFRIETRADVKHDLNVADYASPSDSLPAGVFQVHVEGMDLGNLNAFRFEHDVLGVDANGNPVKPLLPYLIGDTVYADLGGITGVQDPGEPGIPGVKVDLLDENGFLLESTSTDASGSYLFNVARGSFSVLVSPENFVGSGPLAGYASTTGDLLARTVTDSNILTYDFGYRLPSGPSLGDRVWLDFNADGVQDAAEPGIPGVTVELRNAATNALLAATATDAMGGYLFQAPVAAAGIPYRVRVVPPANLTQTYDLDGTLDHVTTATLPSPTSFNLSLDFGYRAEGVHSVTIGDRVWSDLNGDGVQDPGEPGLAEIRLILYGDTDSNGSYELQIKCLTDGEGLYLHSHLPRGKYYVAVDTNSIPNGLALTFDPSSATPPSQGAILNFVNNTRDGRADPSLGSGVDLGQDFGYQGGSSLGDTVWHDTNSDGVQNVGELGIANVVVSLAGDTNTDGVNDYFARTTTNASGVYVFNTLPAGVYTVKVDPSSLPLIMQQTYDLDGLATPHQATSAVLPRTAKLTFDFGYVASIAPPASVGDTVWLDDNRNGTQDAGEKGISAVTVSLLNSAGATVASSTTDADGKYLFDRLEAGAYSISVSKLPAGITQTHDLDGSATPDRAAFSLTPGQNRRDVDFGYGYHGSLGDRVWYDVNRNGTQDAGEPGVGGARVDLRSGSVLVATTTTDTSGAYRFSDLNLGAYTVKFHSVMGYQGFTDTNRGADGAKDSDASVSTGETSAITLTVENRNLDSVDAGLTAVPSLSLLKTADKSTAAPGAPILYSYTVTNTGSVPVTDITVTDDNATPGYSGDDFTVGTVAFLAPGASATLSKSVIPALTMTASNGTEAGFLTVEKLANGDVKATFVQSLAVVDNTYGSGSSAGYRGGSGKGHRFKDLINSDHAEFRFTNAAGAVVLDFYVDDLSVSSTAPSGYGTLGVLGGDGYMIKGSAANVASCWTSAAANLNQSPAYYGYTDNSPINDPNWEVRSIYSVVVKAAAFGTGGFGRVTCPDVHNSPAKIDTAKLEPRPQDVINTAVATARFGSYVLTTASATASVRVQ